jgi:hypothetical protein
MLDTSPEAATAQVEALRRLGPSRRFHVAADMSDAVREMARARISAQHPEFDDLAVQDQLVWELYGVRPKR